MTFITEVKAKNSTKGRNKKPGSHPLLEPLRKDYMTLQAVIGAFNEKVDVLVDKQRAEYTSAYEHHMIDVQNELYNLRQKATAIANDTTREEKLKKLDSDQKWFRNEALRLDVETNEYRKKLREIKAKIHSTEKERDWLLQKLRISKKTFKKNRDERTQLAETVDGGLSMMSNDSSSYTLELLMQKNNGNSLSSELQWRQRLNHDYLVTREATNIPHTAPKQLSPIRGAGTRSLVRQESEKARPKTAEKSLLSKLVTARATQNGIRDFVANCAHNASNGPWSKLPKRNLSEILHDCNTLIESGDDNEELKQSLAYELAIDPETYFAVSHLMLSRPKSSQVNYLNLDDDPAYSREFEQSDFVENPEDFNLDEDVLNYLNEKANDRILGDDVDFLNTYSADELYD